MRYHLRLAAVIVACMSVGACRAPMYDEATLAIVDVGVIPMRGETMLMDHMVVVAGDRIVAVEPTDRSRLPESATVVEGGGAYLTPGLWDMHAHVLSSPGDALERTLPLLVANGVTGVREMGAELAILTEVRQRLAADSGWVAPQLFAAGPLLDGRLKPWYGDLPLILESPEQVPTELARLSEAGVDFFKVYDELAPATFDAIARLANETGMPFAGHVPMRVPTRQAVRAGIRSIEHLNIMTAKDCVEDPDGWFRRWISAKFEGGYDAYYRVVREFWDAVDAAACDAVFTEMADRGVFFTPTLDMELNDLSRLDTAAVKYMLPQSRGWCETVLGMVEGADPALRAEAFDLYTSALKRMRAAGVPVLAGSDTPNNCLVPGFSLHWELALLVEAGLTPYEALAASTTEAARALGLEDVAGRVEPGYQADLVTFESNPLEDMLNSRKITGVVRAGRWHDQASLETMKAGALAAARAAVADSVSG